VFGSSFGRRQRQIGCCAPRYKLSLQTIDLFKPVFCFSSMSRVVPGARCSPSFTAIYVALLVLLLGVLSRQPGVVKEITDVNATETAALMNSLGSDTTICRRGRPVFDDLVSYRAMRNGLLAARILNRDSSA